MTEDKQKEKKETSYRKATARRSEALLGKQQKEMWEVYSARFLECASHPPLLTLFLFFLNNLSHFHKNKKKNKKTRNRLGRIFRSTAAMQEAAVQERFESGPIF